MKQTTHHDRPVEIPETVDEASAVFTCAVYRSPCRMGGSACARRWATSQDASPVDSNHHCVGCPGGAARAALLDEEQLTPEESAKAALRRRAPFITPSNRGATMTKKIHSSPRQDAILAYIVKNSPARVEHVATALGLRRATASSAMTTMVRDCTIQRLRPGFYAHNTYAAVDGTVIIKRDGYVTVMSDFERTLAWVLVDGERVKVFSDHETAKAADMALDFAEKLDPAADTYSVEKGDPAQTDTPQVEEAIGSEGIPFGSNSEVVRPTWAPPAKQDDFSTAARAVVAVVTALAESFGHPPGDLRLVVNRGDVQAFSASVIEESERSGAKRTAELERQIREHDAQFDAVRDALGINSKPTMEPCSLPDGAPGDEIWVDYPSDGCARGLVWDKDSGWVLTAHTGKLHEHSTFFFYRGAYYRVGSAS